MTALEKPLKIWGGGYTVVYFFTIDFINSVRRFNGRLYSIGRRECLFKIIRGKMRHGLF